MNQHCEPEANDSPMGPNFSWPTSLTTQTFNHSPNGPTRPTTMYDFLTLLSTLLKNTEINWQKLNLLAIKLGLWRIFFLLLVCVLSPASCLLPHASCPPPHFTPAKCSPFMHLDSSTIFPFDSDFFFSPFISIISIKNTSMKNHWCFDANKKWCLIMAYIF